LSRSVGSGSYGQVYKARCRVSKQEVAIKFIAKVCESEYDLVKVVREIKLMRWLTEIPGNDHTSGLIDLLVAPRDKNHGHLGLFIVMEFM